MPLEAALKLAQEKGLDLIEIAPKAIPPVAKIISFDKFRYQKEKEARKKEKASKIKELKQIQISLVAAKNDLEIKARKVEEFLSKGHPVDVVLKLKGREKFNKSFALSKLENFLKIIPGEYKILKEPKFGGRGVSIQIKGLP
jgi:translation initiation factor IF-3